MTQLKTSTVAVPSSATIGYQHFIEPHMDSCDGMAGTQGWDPPAVQVYFHWTGTPAALLSYASSHLARAGWGAMTPETDNGVAGGHWSKVIDNGSVAYAQVAAESYGGWALLATAPPVEKAVSGC